MSPTSSSPKRHWLRIGLATSTLMIVVFLLTVQISHFRAWHHLVWLGVHAHILRESLDIGIPGVNNMYAVTASNFTPFPIHMSGCKGPKDTSPYYEITYRFQLEKRESTTGRWTTIMEVPPGCPVQNLLTTTLRPGTTMEVVGWDATGARDGFHKGDLARFSVLTSFNESEGDPRQRVITSPAFIIEDEKLESDIPFRVRH